MTLKLKLKEPQVSFSNSNSFQTVQIAFFQYLKNIKLKWKFYICNNRYSHLWEPSIFPSFLISFPLAPTIPFLGEKREVIKSCGNKETSSPESCTFRGQHRPWIYRGLNSNVNKHYYFEEVSWFLLFWMCEMVNWYTSLPKR